MLIIFSWDTQHTHGKICPSAAVSLARFVSGIWEVPHAQIQILKDWMVKYKKNDQSFCDGHSTRAQVWDMFGSARFSNVALGLSFSKPISLILPDVVRIIPRPLLVMSNPGYSLLKQILKYLKLNLHPQPAPTNRFNIFRLTTSRHAAINSAAAMQSLAQDPFQATLHRHKAAKGRMQWDLCWLWREWGS